MFGLEAAQIERQLRLGNAVAAVLCDHQAPAQGVQRADGIGVAEGKAVGESANESMNGFARCLGGLDEAVRGSHRLLTGTGVHQAENQASPDEDVWCRGRVGAGRGTTRPTVRDGRWPGTRRQPSRRGRTAAHRGACRERFGRHRCSGQPSSIRPVM